MPDTGNNLNRVGRLLGEAVCEVVPLSGGCVADVRLVTMESGRRVVAKLGGPHLDLEADMLRHLRDRTDLPVPRVLHAEPDLLVMDHIEHRGGSGWGGHLAELLTDLHGVTNADGRFGFGSPTLIGPLRLENGWSSDWASFYRDDRLLPLVDEASRRGNLPIDLERRLRNYAGRVDDDLAHGPSASLIHGDVWSGNVLANGSRVIGLIDPSVAYADPEFELAFIALFSTGGRAFFDRYAERRPIDRAFFERRVFIYQLFPLLVHVALFGGGYVGQLDGTLRRIE
jgi:fructosamine-3-kinase